MNKKSGKVQNKNGSSVEKKKAELMPLDDKKTSEKSSFTEFKDAPDKTESDILAGERPGNKVKDKEKTSGKEKPEAPVKRAAPGKKKSLAPVIIAVAAVVIVAGVVIFILGRNGNTPIENIFVSDIEVVLADGTVQTMKASAAFEELSTDRFYKGIVIDGVDVGGMTKDEAYAAVTKTLPQNPEEICVKLKLAEKTLIPNFNDVTVEYNTREVIDTAFEMYRPASEKDLDQLKECYNNVQQLKNTKQNFESSYTIKVNNVRETVEKVLNIYVEEYSEFRDASIVDFDLENREFIIEKEKTGYDIDVESAVKGVEELFESGTYTGTVTVPVDIKSPEVTEAMLREEYGLIGEQTTITNGVESRNVNISQACSNINGTVLEPGEVFSFNEVVGQRTIENGFQAATVIAGGQYEQDLGGGICQVSGTLYNAALKSNLKIIERHGHAWPSDYIDPGLDATVDWPSTDMKFENDSDYKIIIVAWWDPDDWSCNAQIYGKKLPDGQYIETEAEIVSQYTPGPEYTEYVEDWDMPVGETKELRHSYDCITAYAYKVWYDKDGNEIDRVYYDSTYYKPYGRRVAVGVVREDGTYASIDHSTGEILPEPTPEPVVTTTPAPVPDTPTPEPPTPDPPTPDPNTTPDPTPAT